MSLSELFLLWVIPTLGFSTKPSNLPSPGAGGVFGGGVDPPVGGVVGFGVLVNFSLLAVAVLLAKYSLYLSGFASQYALPAAGSTPASS